MKLSRKTLVAILLSLLTVGLVWAGAELFGQANRATADAGIHGADMEMISLEMIKKPAQAPNVDWKKEARLRKQLEANTKEYKKVAAMAKAENERSNAISAKTREKGLNLAREFNDLSEKYAAVWDAAGNCKTRAEMARKAGASRLANADMTFNAIDSDKIEAYNDSMEALQEARQAYVADAKNDLNDADKKALQSSLMPKAKGILDKVVALGSQVSGLVTEVSNEAAAISSGDPLQMTVAIGGCAKKAVTTASSSSSESSILDLLSPVKALLSMCTSLISNIKSFISDLMSLI